MVPDNEFKVTLVSGLLFTHDLKKVFLINKFDDIYGIVNIEINSNMDDKLELNKKFREHNIIINPSSWREVVRIRQYEKNWQRIVLMTSLDKECIGYNNFYDISKLPLVSPYLQWLIPLAIDPQVYGTIYNQILFR